MSLSVTVRVDGRFSHFVKLKIARAKVEKGTHRWCLLAFEKEIEPVPSITVQRPRADWNDPNANFSWKRGESGFFVVMKARRELVCA